MKATLFALVIGVVSSFNVAVLPAARRAPMTVVMGLAESAADCLEEGCSVDTVDSLVSDLKSECVVLNQQGLASSPRNQQILTLITQLEVLNVNPEANKSEMEKIINAASRIFSVVSTSGPFDGEPLGYTGTPGTTTLAGKALD